MTAPYAPTWRSPSAPGQLSNKRGSNTGADALALTARYANPRGTAEPAGTIRVTATRVASGGNPQTQQTAWDSGWVGPSGVSPLPLALKNQAGSPVTAVINGRLYYFASDFASNAGFAAFPACYSAPITGGSLGSWRAEVGPNVYVTSIGYPVECVQVINGRLYVSTQAAIYFASINLDGTFGTWSGPVLKPVQNAGMFMFGDSDGLTYAWITIVGVNGFTSSFAPISLVDGSIGAFTNTTTVVGARNRPMGYYNRVTHNVVLIGGDDNTNGLATITYAAVTPTTGAIGAWLVSGSPLPAGRVGSGIAITGGFVYIIGGSSVVNEATVVSQVATVYFLAQTTIESASVVVWTTATNALPVATSATAGFVTAVSGAGFVSIGIVGGLQAAAIATVYENLLLNTGQTSGAWLSGPLALLATALGVGGAIVPNSDGTQDITFAYAAFGLASLLSGFLDGDQVQIVVQFTGASGDPGPASSATVVKIGQPPTISNVVIGAGGQPLISWAYNAGAGGGPEQQWQAALDSGLFDSGIQRNQQNTVQVKAAPMLPNAVLRTVTITVKSNDVPLPGSSNSAVSAPTFTPAYVASALPTGFAAVPNPALGSVTFSWTNPLASTATFNRIYRRLAGVGAYVLLKDNVVAVINALQSIELMDDIPFNVAYDYAVSAVGPGPGESAQAAPVLGVTLTPPDYGMMLHVAGVGPANRAALKARGPGKITRVMDLTTALSFGATAPTARYGPENARLVDVSYLLDSAALAATEDTITAAVIAGGTLCYRDTMGHVIYCAFVGRDRTLGRFRDASAKLEEVAFVYAP